MSQTQRRSLIYLLLPLFLILLAGPAILLRTIVIAETAGDYTYTVTDGQATITDFSQTGGDLVIPATLGGYPVVAIADRAFWYCNLQSVTIPDSVTSIGDFAFSDSPNLKSVSLGSGVASLGRGPFWYCSALTTIDVDPANGNLTSAAGILYNEDQSELLFYPAGRTATTYAIPAGVKHLGEGAFLASTSLTSLQITDGVETLGDLVFSYCKALTDVQFADSVTTVGDQLFSYCTALVDVDLSASLTALSSRMFLYCQSLASLEIPASVTSIGDFACDSCESLATVTIPDGVTSIGLSAFSSCTSLAALSIPGSVSSIGTTAFISCTGLTRVSLAEGLTAIGDSAFYGCSSLPGLDLPASLTTVADSAFANCTRMTALTVAAGSASFVAPDGVLYSKGQTALICYPAGKPGTAYAIPNTVTRIAAAAFSQCSALVNVQVSSQLTEIGYNAFNACSSLASVSLPTTLQTIASSAFSGCSSLASLNLAGAGGAGSLSTIGDDAFSGCAMTRVSIPKNVTRLGEYAFASCAGLQKVYFFGKAPQLGEGCFSGCADGFTIYYLANKTGFTTPAWEGYATAVFVPQSTLTARSGGYNSVKLAWHAADSAQYYQIYRAGSADGTFSRIKTLASSETSYQNTGLTTGRTCYYKIRAYRVVADSRVYSTFSKVVAATPVPSVPASFKAQASGTSSIRLTWQAVAGASGYRIYRATSAGGSFTLVKTIGSARTTSYTNGSLKKGQTYYYKMRAYRMVGDTRVFGSYTAVKSARPAA